MRMFHPLKSKQNMETGLELSPVSPFYWEVQTTIGRLLKEPCPQKGLSYVATFLFANAQAREEIHLLGSCYGLPLKKLRAARGGHGVQVPHGRPCRGSAGCAGPAGCGGQAALRGPDGAKLPDESPHTTHPKDPNCPADPAHAAPGIRGGDKWRCGVCQRHLGGGEDFGVSEARGRGGVEPRAVQVPAPGGGSARGLRPGPAAAPALRGAAPRGAPPAVRCPGAPGAAPRRGAAAKPGRPRAAELAPRPSGAHRGGAPAPRRGFRPGLGQGTQFAAPAAAAKSRGKAFAAILAPEDADRSHQATRGERRGRPAAVARASRPPKGGATEAGRFPEAPRRPPDPASLAPQHSAPSAGEGPRRVLRSSRKGRHQSEDPK